MTHLGKTLAAALLAASFAAPLAATELGPVQAQAIELGSLRGVAYYTPEPGGFRFVATFADPEGGVPLRVTGMLADGQAMTFSVPRGAGEAALEASFLRRGETVIMRTQRISSLR